MQGLSTSLQQLPPAHVALEPGQGGNTSALDTDDDKEAKAEPNLAFGKLRARFQLRAMANKWRRTAVANVLPGLRPFIPRLLASEMLALANWCGSVHHSMSILHASHSVLAYCRTCLL